MYEWPLQALQLKLLSIRCIGDVGAVAAAAAASTDFSVQNILICAAVCCCCRCRCCCFHSFKCERVIVDLRRIYSFLEDRMRACFVDVCL